MTSEYISRRNFLKLLKLLPLAFVQNRAPGMPSDADAPNILIMVFDSFSANHMSLFGYPRDTTPQLNRIAEKAVVYHNHQAGGNFTVPGTASLLTGTYPWTHRALHHDGGIHPMVDVQNMFDLFNPQYQTFAYSHNPFTNNLLYQFHAGIDQLTRRSELCVYTNSVTDLLGGNDFRHHRAAEIMSLRPEQGMAGTFFLSGLNSSLNFYRYSRLTSQYPEFPRGVPSDFNAFYLLEDAIPWVQRQVVQQPNPFLGYVHLLPPHFLYKTRQEFVDIFLDDLQPPEKPISPFAEIPENASITELRRHYDEYIPYVDAEFANLFDFMAREGFLENTYLIMTSDHGESFERGVWAHNTPLLSEELTRVPLMIWGPGIEERVDIHANTSNIDLLPTLLQFSGMSVPAECEGEVLPPFNTVPVDEERSVFVVEAKENPTLEPLEKVSVSLAKGPYKLIHYTGYEDIEAFFEFYDLEADPEEMENLYPARPAVAAQMREELLDILSDQNSRFG